MHAHPSSGRWLLGWTWIAAAIAAVTGLLTPGTAHADPADYTITVDLGDWTQYFESFQAVTNAPTRVAGKGLEPIDLVPGLTTKAPLSCQGDDWTLIACDSRIEFTLTVHTPTLEEITTEGRDPNPDDIAKAVEATFTIDGKDPVDLGKNWATVPCPAAQPTIVVSAAGKSWPVPDWDLYPANPCI